MHTHTHTLTHTHTQVLVEEVKGLGFGAELLADADGYQEGKLDLTVSGGGRKGREEGGREGERERGRDEWMETFTCMYIYR